MFDRLTSFDLYGNLVPGVVALLLVGVVPMGAFNDDWPDLDLASAAASIVLAYVVGLVIQGMAEQGLSSRGDRGRHPSDYLLDGGDSGLFPPTRLRLVAEIETSFGIVVNGDAKHDCPQERRGVDVLPAVDEDDDQLGRVGGRAVRRHAGGA